MGRYVYSSHKTLDAAMDALDAAFAEGVVSPGERPVIEWRHVGSHFHNRGRYVITLPERTATGSSAAPARA